MSHQATDSLLTLPVELVYRILDHLDNFTILTSFRDVCERLNAITDSYHPYEVNFTFVSVSRSTSITTLLLSMVVIV